MREILELVQSKGEEACAYFIHILHEAYDAYIDLRPWFKDIEYKPSEFLQQIPVVNTDPSKLKGFQYYVNIMNTIDLCDLCEFLEPLST